MKKRDPGEKLIDFISEMLSSGEENEVIESLHEEGMTAEDIDSLKKVNRLIDQVEIHDPSPEMDDRFYEMLSGEGKETISSGKAFPEKDRYFQTGITTLLKIAAGIALFILGWFSGSRINNLPGTSMTELSNEVKGLKEALVLTMLGENSSFDRIKAVNMASEFESPDARIIGSLLEALNHDPNDNVRLLALEALLKYSGNPIVRKGLVESIQYQSSPMIQLRLSEVMINLDEKQAVPEFKKVLMDAGLNYNVRRAIDHAVTVLL